MGNEKCFGLEEYKDLAIIHARYLHCEAQSPLVLSLIETVDDKHAALQLYASDLELSLSQIEAEREAYIVSATTSAEQTAIEARRKTVWRALAIGGLVVSLALGAVVTGMGVSQ